MKLLPQRKGTSSRTGNDWVAQPFVFEYLEDPHQRFPDKVVLEIFDVEQIKLLREGMWCRCGFGHSTNEYNGRTYNEVKLYKFEMEPTPDPSLKGREQEPVGVTQAPVQAQPSIPFQAKGEQGDDLPF